MLAGAALGLLTVLAAGLQAQTPCDATDINACVDAANTAYAVGDYSGWVVANYRQACELGNLRGCNNLGNLLLHGQGVTQDLTQANDYYWRACNGGLLLGCANLGNLYRDGQGVPADLDRALALYQMACQSRVGLGCYQRACSLGHTEACARIGATPPAPGPTP